MSLVDPTKAREIVDELPHDCEWSSRLGEFEGCEFCLKCRLTVALGGVDQNGRKDAAA